MIRIPEALVTEILLDLQRPHPFAHERVGFAFGGSGTTADGSRLVLIKRYLPVTDDNYLNIDGPPVGAAINETAIRTARQEALTSGDGIFHIHQHAWLGDPGFSSVDLEGYRKMIPSFVPMAPRSPHGAIIFSLDDAGALVRWPGCASATRTPVTVVGFPMRFWGTL